MIKDFKYRHNANVQFGKINTAAKKIKEFGFKKPFIIYDVHVKGKILDFLYELSSLNAMEYYGNEPTYDLLDETKKLIRKKGYDCVIGIGGGSTMDFAKGLAVLATNPGPAIRYKGFPLLKNNPLPVITVPTLPGTGSEIAFNAVFTDTKNKTRLGINTELNYPLMAFVDPELSNSAPVGALVSSTMDCMCHAVSSYISPNASPFTKVLAKEAANHLIDSLPSFNRDHLFIASMMANMSLNNAGCGLEGDFSYPLGANYNIPHGVGEGIFLPYLARLYVKKGFKGFSGLFGTTNPYTFIDYLEDFYIQIEAPNNLDKYNITRKDIPLIISQVRNSLKTAPVKITEKEIETMLKKFIRK